MNSPKNGESDVCLICHTEQTTNVFACRDGPGACVNRICSECLGEWFRSGAKCVLCMRGHPSPMDHRYRLALARLKDRETPKSVFFVKVPAIMMLLVPVVLLVVLCAVSLLFYVLLFPIHEFIWYLVIINVCADANRMNAEF